MPAPFRTTAYRYPNEHLVLAGTLLLVFLVIAVSATATLCASVAFVLFFVTLSYYSTRTHHQGLLRRASPVTHQSAPALARLVDESAARLQPGDVQVFVVPARAPNAYTFGLEAPKVVVLYSALLQIMDEDELRFIIGHELGHIRLGHTWLNSLVGGVAGIPSPGSAYALLSLALLSWNRACEHSADRAGLLACGKPEKAVSALIKLVAGPHGRTAAGLELAYRQIDAEDDSLLGSLGEALSSHPMLIRRIQELRRYAASVAYARLQARMDQNLAGAYPDAGSA
jgi:Zn-dependent protease with chaperone function